MRRNSPSVRSQSTVIGVVLLVGLTVLLGGVVAISVSSVEPPSDIEDAIPERGPSPFSADRVGGSFTGEAVEVSMYDSAAGAVVDGSPNETTGSPPPSVDNPVSQEVFALEGSPPLPDDSGGGAVRVTSGDYYANSSNYVYTRWDDKRVVFDTSDGAVRIGLDGDGFFNTGRILAEGTEFVVDGSHPVEIYVERSSSVDLSFENVEFDVQRTDAFRVYAQSDEGWSNSNVDIEDSEFRGTVYAPGSEVEVIDSEFYGASVAENTVLEGSSYYHDRSLSRLGTDALP